MKPERIRRLRTHLRLSQSQLARQLDVTTTTVSFWETGRTAPTLAHRERLEGLEKQQCSCSSTPAFRPIQYLGSKLKLAQKISELLEAVSAPADTVGDLFSGSAVVSSALTRQRRVIAVEMQGYATALADAVLRGKAVSTIELRSEGFINEFEVAQARLTDRYQELVALDDRALVAAARGDGKLLDQLISFGSVAAHQQRPKPGTPAAIERAMGAVTERIKQQGVSPGGAAFYYGGVYFSMRQAIALDALRICLDQLTAGARLLGIGVLLSVASELANTVGKQFAQPMRIVKADGATQPLLLARAIRDRKLSVLTAWFSWLGRWEEELAVPRLGGRAAKKDVLAFVDEDTECSAFYADPPYTIDHYSRFYHVLETLALNDTPLLDTQRQGGAEVIMRGLYRAGRHQSEFSVPSSVDGAFRRLFKGVARGGRSLVLSYSPFDPGKGHRPRLLSLKEITGLARAEFCRVEALVIENHSHRKLNAREVNVDGPSSGETLIMCEA